MKRATNTENEIFYVVLGEVKNGIWHGRLSWKRIGSHASVDFDGNRVLAREEKRGDVIGFLHTHPEGCVTPSDRDHRTMKAWAFCFGKPLLCGIKTSEETRAWCYTPQGAIEEYDRVAIFKRGWLSAVLDSLPEILES